jgi:surface antigen
MSAHALRPHLLIAAAVGLLLVVVPPSAAAQSGTAGILKDSPADNFTPEDMQLFQDTMKRALDAPPDPAGIAWENPKTKAHGHVTNEAAFTWKDHDCRRLVWENEARGQSSRNKVGLCMVDGKWRAISPSDLEAAGKTP